jgi:hypothetical protein
MTPVYSSSNEYVMENLYERAWCIVFSSSEQICSGFHQWSNIYDTRPPDSLPHPCSKQNYIEQLS